MSFVITGLKVGPKNVNLISFRVEVVKTQFELPRPANRGPFLLPFAAQKIFDFCSTYVLPARATSTPVLVTNC